MNSRRAFLKFMGKTTAAAALAPMVYTEASHSAGFTDYKAIVYISLLGGNDAFNMVIPTRLDGAAGYDNYKAIRTSLAIPNVNLSVGLTTDSSGNLDLRVRNPYAEYVNGSPYTGKDGKGLDAGQSYMAGYYPIDSTDIAINAVMPEVAHLMNTGKLAVIGNIGTLVEPTTKSDILTKSVSLPVHLFAHNHQQRIQSTGIANDNKAAGWAGRLFKDFGDVGGDTILGGNISFSGYAHVLTGGAISALNLSTNPRGHRTRNFSLHKEMANSVSENAFERVYGTLIGRSFDLSESIATAWSSTKVFNARDAYGNTLFSSPDRETLNFLHPPKGALIKQLEAVAKMIDYGRDNGVKRQVFYVNLGGFDTHGSQLDNHPVALREVSMALGKFQLAMEELGVSDSVTSFTVSDFGRSVANNGDGTDHAWAGHNLVMGGAVKGGELYGEIPDFTLSGLQDYGRNGRMIPTIAVEQQFSTILKWFGVGDALLDTVFPNLTNFDFSPYGRDMGFMRA